MCVCVRVYIQYIYIYLYIYFNDITRNQELLIILLWKDLMNKKIKNK